MTVLPQAPRWIRGGTKMQGDGTEREEVNRMEWGPGNERGRKGVDPLVKSFMCVMKPLQIVVVI